MKQRHWKKKLMKCFKRSKGDPQEKRQKVFLERLQNTDN